MEPPSTMNLSGEDITYMLKNNSQLEIEKLPCHSQAVERRRAEARDG